MSGTLNKVMLIGYLGGNVKIHYFEKQDCIARFSLATNETYTDKGTGKRTTTTQWHNIVVKNKLAEICEQHLTKGDKIYCEGKIKTREREQDGIKKNVTEIYAQDITFLSPKVVDKTKNVVAEKPNAQGIIKNLPF